MDVCLDHLQPMPITVALCAPAGTITCLFTDIQDSTRLWSENAFFPLLKEQHDAALRSLARHWNGYEVVPTGDGFFFAFSKATDAVQFALAAQRVLADSFDANAALRVRIGMHTGEAQPMNEGNRCNYVGPVVNMAARIMGAAHGGQTLISESTYNLACLHTMDDIAYADCGVHVLKGVGERRIWQIADTSSPHSQEFPPLNTLTPPAHNLPPERTPFIGRQAEIALWQERLLHPATRLVTLVGFGGIGKTRTAWQLAHHNLNRYAQGVCWVELEETRTAEGLWQRLAQALKLHLQPRLSVQEQTVAFLCDQAKLIVFDGMEQIPDAACAMDALLQAAPKLQCLVTSRCPLEIQHEEVIEISPLTEAEAEAMFLSRISRLRTAFVVTPNNRADIRDLCRKLEGLPLLIEIAAAQIENQTPREMLSQLGTGLRLLQRRAPDLPPRQRALRGTIDWSHDLLSESEKTVFAQLAAFAGGFTRSDAEAICEADEVSTIIAALRRHSLLSARVDPVMQQNRFFMLESLRAYAQERLEATPDGGRAVRQRHGQHFLALAQAHSAAMETTEEPYALHAMAAMHDNLCMTLHEARQEEDHALYVRLVLALYPYLFRRGLWGEATRRLESALAAATLLPESEWPLIAGTRHCLANVALNQGEKNTARSLVEASLNAYLSAQALEGHWAQETAENWNLCGLIATENGQWEEAERCLVNGLAALPVEASTLRAKLLHNRARLAQRQGQIDASGVLYRQALVQRRAGGDMRGEAETLGNLGTLAYLAEDYAEAERLYRDSLRRYAPLDYRFGIAVMLYNLGDLALTRGDDASALPYLLHAARLFREMGSNHLAAAMDAIEQAAARVDAKTLSLQYEAIEQSDWQFLLSDTAVVIQGF